jgi:arginine decarboxylase
MLRRDAPRRASVRRTRAASGTLAVVDQAATPYLDALLEYAGRDPGRFHIPGHKGGPAADPRLRDAFGEAMLGLDIPAGIEGIDVAPDPANTPFQRAQRLAAEAWGARRSWFLLNGASGGNQAACLALAHRGDRVVVQRNVHSSAIDGLVLAGLRPLFVAPEIDPELGIAHCLAPAALARALDDAPDAVGAITVSPTYFGAIADVGSLAAVAHDRGIPLVVDEAWGAHLHFCSRLPTSALESGADVVLSSVHKIVGSLTQSAILHLGAAEGRLEEAVLDRAVTAVESTSPSALLTASLDVARSQMATHGEGLLEQTVESLSELREDIRGIEGLDVLDQRIAGRPGVHAFDPLRVVVDVRDTGTTGHRIARLMRERDDVNLELYSENVVVAVFGAGEDPAVTGKRLVAALEHAVGAVRSAPGAEQRPFAEPPPWGPPELSPRKAFLAQHDVVPFDQADGRVAAESLAAYPPGVPNVLPGERLTRPTLDYIRDSVAHGGVVRGASDRTLQTIRVVAE